MNIHRKLEEIEAITDINSKYLAASELFNLKVSFYATECETCTPEEVENLQHSGIVPMNGIKRLSFEDMTNEQKVYFTKSLLEAVKTHCC
jgi:hypothetical protein